MTFFKKKKKTLILQARFPPILFQTHQSSAGANPEGARRHLLYVARDSPHQERAAAAVGPACER